MLEIGPQHSLEYRQEILSPLFGYVKSAESFYVVGAASIGKTRLLDFMMRSDVRKHYLQEDVENHWLVRVDMNRLAGNEDWGFYELLLSSIMLSSAKPKSLGKLEADIVDLDSNVMQQRDLLSALRFFELAIYKLCDGLGLKICFLLDEFDETYRDLPRKVFMQLRAIRDANKNRVSFGLLMRHSPDQLRSPRDNESFYELLSRNCIGLKPYTYTDAIGVIQQLEVRRNFPLDPGLRKIIFDTSGGHSGSISAILSTLIEVPNSRTLLESPGWLDWISQQDNVVDECRKIWDGLSNEEQEWLVSFAKGEFDKISLPIERLLTTKGLLKRDDGGNLQLFSYPLERYIKGRKT